jgi:P27 family predicted phage terminase small subunit
MPAKLIAFRSKPAPSNLSPEAQRWWRSIISEYGISDGAGLLLLQQALEAFDRVRGAQAQIAQDGLVSRGSKRQARAHPLLAVERDSRAAMLASLRSLNLDLEPLRDRPGRPAGSFMTAERDHADEA